MHIWGGGSPLPGAGVMTSACAGPADGRAEARAQVGNALAQGGEGGGVTAGGRRARPRDFRHRGVYAGAAAAGVRACAFEEGWGKQQAGGGGGRSSKSPEPLPAAAAATARRRSCLRHRLRHCWPVLPGRLDAMRDQRFGPYWPTSLVTTSSSSLLQGPFMAFCLCRLEMEVDVEESSSVEVFIESSSRSWRV